MWIIIISIIYYHYYYCTNPGSLSRGSCSYESALQMEVESEKTHVKTVVLSVQ